MRIESSRRKKFGSRWLLASLWLLIVACLVAIGLIAYDYFQVTQTGVVVPQATQTIDTDDPPSEKDPGTVMQNYTVPADQPRSIRIPKLKVDAYVQRVGITKSNAMATPNNIAFTGWYVKSVAPGSDGLSIINGHAGGRYTNGVFKFLKNLSEGDTLQVQLGDLSWHNYEVTSVKTVSVSDANTALYKRDESIKKQLNLITCDGDFNDKTQTYNERTIVVAKGI